MRPLKDISSTNIGRSFPTNPFPTRIASTTFGLTLFLSCRAVKSETSLGTKANRQSIKTISSSDLGYVLTWTTRGGLVPRVNLLNRNESRNAGVWDDKI